MSISQLDFSTACHRLHEIWQKAHNTDASWQDVGVFEDFTGTWLRISRILPTGEYHTASAQRLALGLEAETVLDETDDEALHVTPGPQAQAPLVIYDVVYSPSYQVPVLYITFRNVSPDRPGLPPPDQVYDMLVPPSYRAQIDAVGVMGALSMTDHPITSTPAYFLHPCRTEEAVVVMGAGNRSRPAEYLLQWIGIVGQSVGLEVPVELAQTMCEKAAGDVSER